MASPGTRWDQKDSNSLRRVEKGYKNPNITLEKRHNMTYVRRKIQTYTKVYFEAFGYDYEDDSVFVPSELTGKKAVDIHHIIGRGNAERIELRT